MADTSGVDNQLQRDLTRIIAEVQRQLPDIDIRVDVDTSSLRALRTDTDDADRSILRMATSVLGGVAALAKFTAGAGLAAAGLGGITAAAAGAIAALGGIEGITNQAAGALSVLAAARGVLQVALIGISDAIGALGGTTEEFTEAIEGLAPAAQSVAREFRAALPAFTEFQQGIQQSLFARLAGDDIAARLASSLDRLEPSARGVAQAFGAAGERLASFLTQESTLQNLDTILKAAVPLVTALGEAITEFLGGALERAADGTSQFGQTFAGLQTVFQTIAGVAENIGRIFAAIGDAAEATGGSIAGPLGSAIGLVADVLESDAGQQLLRTLMELGQIIVSTVAPVLGTLVAAAAPLIQVIASGLIPIIEALQEPLQVLIQALGDALTPIMEQLAPVIGLFADLVAQTVITLAPLLPLVGQLAAALLPALIPVIQTVMTVFDALLPVLVQFVSSLLPALIPLFQELTPAIAELIEPVGELAIQLGPALADLFASLTPLIILVVQAVVKLIPVVSGLLRISVDLSSGLLQTLIPAIQAVAALLRGDFSQAIAKAKEFFRGQIDFIIGFFRALPGRVLSALSSLAPGLASRARDAGDRFIQSIREKINSALAILRALPGQAVSALAGAGNVLYSAGRALIQGFIDGLKSMLGTVKDVAGDIVGSVRDYFPFSPAKVGPLSGNGYTDRAGESLMNGFIAGIRAMTPELTRTVSQSLATGTSPLTVGALTPSAGTAALSMAPVTVGSPNVAVYIGNEQLTGFIDVQVQRDRRITERRLAQGVRR